MSKKIVSLFNTKLAWIKSMIRTLFDDTKTQYLKQLSKSFASYIELRHVYPKRNDYADDFQDLVRVDVEDNLVLDRDGYNLGCRIDEKKFKSDSYTMDTYPMIMVGGQVIPGSKFSAIFNEGIGFWGYQCDVATDAYFTIDFETKEEINKVFLSTNNTVSIDLYIKEDYDKEWVKIGMRNGLNHVWNFKPQDCVSLKFQSNTMLFAVARLQAGLASYQQSGTLESEYYTMSDLYKLRLTTDAHIPENTMIDFYIGVSGQITEYPITNDTIITGSVLWQTASGTLPVYELPSSYIDDSLSVRVGYNEWDVVETYDWAWTVVPSTDMVVSSGIITIGSEYTIIEGSLRQVLLGQTLFTEGIDYSASYNIDERKIIVKRLDNSSIPTTELDNLTFAVLARKRDPVNQLRTYVTLEADTDIILQGFTTPFSIRHVVIKNDIVRDTTQEINSDNMSILLINVNGVSSYVIGGLTGINLIELVYLNVDGTSYIPDDMPDIINVEHFAKGYNLLEVADDPNTYEYTLDAVTDSSGIIQHYHLTPGASGTLWFSYAESLGIDVNVKLIAKFASADGENTPTLRSYEIENFLI